MNGNVIFIAGVYGVGKSTICKKLSDYFKIPAFSCSELISRKNGENYGPNKYVANKINNQVLLINSVKEEVIKSSHIFLTGHFCIFNKDNNVDILPEFVYKELYLEKILLLEADANIIINNLKNRDEKKYTINEMEKLQLFENKQATKIAYDLKIPLIKYKMKFDKFDFERIKNIIEGSEI